MKYLASIFFFLSLSSCYDKYSKKDYYSTTPLKNGLYVETFTVFGSGASGTDMMSDYLTDSLSFRIYAGTYDQGSEYYYYNMNGDSIIILKYKSDPSETGNRKLIDKQVYFSSKLKRGSSYEK